MIREFKAPDHVFVASAVFEDRVVARDMQSNAYLLDSDARIISQSEIPRGVSDRAAVSSDGRIFFCSDHSFELHDSDGKYLERYEFDDYPAEPNFLPNGDMLFGCGKRILSGNLQNGFRTLYEDSDRVFPLLLDSGNIIVHVQRDNSPKRRFVLLNSHGELIARLPEFSCGVGVNAMPGGRVALWYPRGGASSSGESQVSIFSEAGDLLCEKFIEHGDPVPLRLNDGNWVMTAGNSSGYWIHILDDAMSVIESYPLPEDFSAAVFGITPDGGFISGDRDGNVCVMSGNGDRVKVIKLNEDGALDGPIVSFSDGTIIIGSRVQTLYFLKPDEYAV